MRVFRSRSLSSLLCSNSMRVSTVFNAPRITRTRCLAICLCCAWVATFLPLFRCDSVQTIGRRVESPHQTSPTTHERSPIRIMFEVGNHLSDSITRRHRTFDPQKIAIGRSFALFALRTLLCLAELILKFMFFDCQAGDWRERWSFLP